MIGTTWIDWFGFNADPEGDADGIAIASSNTHLEPLADIPTWTSYSCAINACATTKPRLIRRPQLLWPRRGPAHWPFAISDINVGAGYLVVVAFLGLRVSANKEVNISRVDGGKPAQVNMMTPA
ncbi:hypothetical protein PC119_g11599 [Phytophthora cactorum]|uniref:Uncharacterized protein n=1 Tax=Phytophthora cactorum TaxID=29920 RepID=A0A8T1D9C7_9STRA|nr:hypothetical protein PC114_g11999 [Phytophthora cactorum]KAG2937508.1 hypothetical protein PC117_g11670 [Phytophthora cactorum]KAG3015823.1 hypothetical protein PC119_g11599 [Phytophthora cactorum]KAG3018373.1 hypothetical protein PC120_g10480 [Phytophthora cactorum]KAG3052463.1 hypothetical protein PC121_g17302 [Phytophthora cactorum]